MKTHRATAMLLPAALLTLLAGCPQQDASAAQGDDDPPPNAALKTPPIHLRQTGYTVTNGHPYVETFYKHMLSNCQKAHGKLRLTPIPGKQVNKLGRTYYDIWFQGDQTAIRSTSWGFKVRHLCQFQALRHERMAIANADGVYSINLDDGTALHHASSGVVRHAIRPATPEQKATDARQKTAVIATLKKQGYAGALDTAPSDPTPTKVAGQPCTQTSSPAYGDPCVWSGGMQWASGKTPHPRLPATSPVTIRC